MPATDSESHRAELMQFDAATGFRGDGIWRFTITKPMDYLGISVDDIKAGANAVIRFNEPDTENQQMTGLVEVDSDIPAGRAAVNHRKITYSSTSLSFTLSDETLSQLGVSFDVEAGIPPVIDIWAGDGAFMVKSVTTETYPVRQMSDPLQILPTQMRADFEAVEFGNYTLEEWADERGLARPETSDNLPEHYIRRNITEASDRLKDLGVDIDDLTPPADADREEITFKHIGRVKLQKYDSGSGEEHRINLTAAIREALPEAKLDGPISLEYDLTEYYGTHDEPELGVVPAFVATGEEANEGRGRKVTDTLQYAEDNNGHSFRVRVPNDVLEALGYSVDTAAGEYITVLAGTESLLFEPVDKRTYRIDDPGVVEQYPS